MFFGQQSVISEYRLGPQKPCLKPFVEKEWMVTNIAAVGSLPELKVDYFC